MDVNLLNQILAGLFSVVEKALHMISSATPCRCIKVLIDSKWSKGSLDSSWSPTVAYRTLVEGGTK